MESRKRKSELELYIDKLTDPPEKQKKMAEFYNSLRLFYKRRWNAQLKLPHVQGVEVNLYRLYDTVMALGGWQKVAAGDKWSDIAEMFGCKDDILCGDHAIKLIYMRYLSKFEQVETIGDVDDYVDNEMSRSRGRNATSFFATNDNPMSIERHHIVQTYRDERGQIINDPDYARLTKSLLSGLPNEIDFAMNVCMLLSHAGPKQIRISHAPHLLTLLVAHTGVYDEEDKSMKDLGVDWAKTTRHDFRSFWAQSGVPLDLLMAFLDREIESEYVDDDDPFFTGVSHKYDVKDTRCWRLNQVITVIRNLSFEAVNRVTMVKSWPVMKFLIMCAYSKWSPLNVAALDTISNLATDIDLTDKALVYVSQHAILRIINECIFSPDKLKLIRAMEILTGLCSFEGNETIICDWLKPEIIAHIYEIVGVKDIMMCVYVLECLYQISEMGDTACDMLSESAKSIQQLVSMATLEAVSFGPAGLAGMKVVEYQPNFGHPAPSQQQQHPQQQQVQHHQYAQRMVPGPSHQHHQTPHQAPHPAQQQPPMTVRQVIQNNLALQQAQQQMNPQIAPAPHPANSHYSHPPNGKFDRRTGTLPVKPIAPSNANSGEGQLELLTEKWIKQNCVFEPAMSTARGELYAAYVDDLRTYHHSMSGSLAMFSGVMKNLYPDVNFRMAQNGVMIVAQGIRLVRPHRLAPAGSAQAAPLDQNPLMRKMLTEPSSSSEALQAEPAANGVMVNGHASTSGEPAEEEKSPESPTEKKSPSPAAVNGTVEVCQEPIQASKLFDENDANQVEVNEVAIEIRDQFVNESDAVKLEVVEKDKEKDKEKINGIICNGHTKAPKKDTVASRAAHIVAVAAACNGDLEKMNGVTESNGNLVRKEEKEKDAQKAEEGEEEAQKEVEAQKESPKEPVEEDKPKEAVTAEPQSDRKCVPVCSTPTDYMCDWDCCSLYYFSPSHVLKHLSEEHVAEELRVLCRWNGCADPTPRNRWSLITHIQDVHCNETQLKQAAQRRKDGVVIPTVRRSEIIPRDLNNHPGYATNAANEAIRRHAFNFLTRELPDEAEGPVTKSIRLTSCLILRNLARYSSDGRQKLRRHESHISWLALSKLESSHALSQLLSELHQAPAAEEESQKSLSQAPSSASLSSMAGSSSQLPPIPDSPTTQLTEEPFRKPVPKPVAPVNRMLNFSSLGPSTSSDKPSTSFAARHQPIQHLPTQPSPLVQTTPLRAGAGN
ncbi:Protein CBR-SWSN-7 [Caenorhabditis briggsae]|uniref:Uncharacterized protein n=2 Tax=Caenorhabditis briggsae TaxID=6238 RepID=A0AAE9E8X6_CAEBR|nr:Protein CBR-SWSN-7 [Caenorhabditis briggsae]UMM16284.1 hypothetical protein L5515_013363 [Caenorhabditis briggsae]CAP32258.1 Protein CBR-SWSN-7 [Caenorhabditis briggsae]